MKGGNDRSLKWQLVQRLILLQSLILLAVLAALFIRGDLFSFRSSDRTIEAIGRAMERDRDGVLRLRSTPELTALRMAEPGLWFVARDENGYRLSEGPVPPAFILVADTLSGIGQARFGATVDSEAMDQPEARMRQVTTPVGKVQILTGTESPALFGMVALGALLVFIKVALPILLVIVLGIVIATPLVVRATLAGIAKVEEQAALIDIGRKGARLDAASTPPEIASLIGAVNEALRRLDEGYDRHQRFLADAAHELRTPISILDIRIAGLPSIPEKARLMADVARLAVLTEQLLDLERLRRDVGPFEAVSLRLLAKRIISDMAPLAFASGYKLDLDFEEANPTVCGDQAALERVLTSLIQNAVDHGGGEGTITVRIGAPALIEVSDEGPGIPLAERERIFEPFHRLKPRARGAGLGLHLVKQIVNLHGGQCIAGDSPTGGARITISLPALAAGPER
ncbi:MULTISPECIES: HAMP domain-containing sensor histidine kinase [unclassified Beijerinckia]|uniref:sensor histidine kinase n=1 Tax=unclassified Beijerinckia TaxID=2638183 RepID=UPI00089D5041|nr:MULTISPECIES: HAMP domain-containing sensor histidine kinase [unclassified Beijerinckia]MDH7796806.1 signal transduction histidine kinase [Beijerinckia sp. GAS462]SEC60636.1 Signal transduction histidine kinase [Beijerinckia sp. 28-YEA-48]